MRLAYPNRRPDFGNRFTPHSAWLFSGSSRVTDRSGNGRTLTPSGGTPDCASYVPGLAATRFGSFSLTSGSTSFNFLGAVTTEIVCHSPQGYALMGWGGSGEIEAVNYTWQVAAYPDGYLAAFWERNSGTDVLVQTPCGNRMVEWTHLVWARNASGLTAFYVNGVSFGTASGSMPTGGTSGSFAFGGSLNSSIAWSGLYAANYTSVLTASQVGYLARLRGIVV